MDYDSDVDDNMNNNNMFYIKYNYSVQHIAQYSNILCNCESLKVIVSHLREQRKPCSQKNVSVTIEVVQAAHEDVLKNLRMFKESLQGLDSVKISDLNTIVPTNNAIRVICIMTAQQVIFRFSHKKKTFNPSEYVAIIIITIIIHINLYHINLYRKALKHDLGLTWNGQRARQSNHTNSSPTEASTE